MVKLKAWFKKHIRYEVFSFMGFVFSITVFLFNIATNQIVPLQYSLLDSETTPYADPTVFYVPYILFSVVLLAIAGTCLYVLIRKRR